MPPTFDAQTTYTAVDITSDLWSHSLIVSSTSIWGLVSLVQCKARRCDTIPPNDLTLAWNGTLGSCGMDTESATLSQVEPFSFSTTSLHLIFHYHSSLHRTKMAIAKSLAFLVSFLNIQRITAVLSKTTTHTVKLPVIITMHVGQPVTVTQQSQIVTSHVPILTVCPLGAHSS